MRSFPLALLCLLAALPAGAIEPCTEDVTAQIRVDPGHPWRPPFGLDRVGAPVTAVAEIAAERMPAREYSLVGYLDGEEIGRYALVLSGEKSTWTGRASFAVYPTELILLAKCRFQGEPVEVSRRAVQPPAFEAEAIARPEELVNPVDLGAILVPADWLLLKGPQKSQVEVAAISRSADVRGARVAAWFESSPAGKVSAPMELMRNRRVQTRAQLPAPGADVEHDVLHVEIRDAAGKELWRKEIQTMIVRNPPHWPEFGATATKLRYDAPISVRDINTGELSSMKYSEGWDPRLNDVVVSLPGGARFVFWRGSSYVPFWAGQHNTALSYEWAETTPPPGGFVDSVEPLMDKELRYGRVEIIESTPARVHVRWTYQSCDFTYKVWGDEAAEDFYFYPDGFGTRVMNLKHSPGVEYELSEFIVLAPASAYPFSFLPEKIVKLLFADGMKQDVSFPYVMGPEGKYAWPARLIEKAQRMPVLYRVRLHKEDAATAIYFNPLDTHLPPAIFAPFFDRGSMVTPVYWGSHWPLARGKSTGWTIDDRIHYSPSHNSVMSWGLHSRPVPIRTAHLETLDTLGQAKPMDVEQWVWLIGMTDAPDTRVLEWAHSFSTPPSMEAKGARMDHDSYVPERRAVRLKVEGATVEMMVNPTVKWINPVFELTGTPGALMSVSVAGRPLGRNEYAWDGKTLWLKVDIDQPRQIRLEFEKSAR